MICSFLTLLLPSVLHAQGYPGGGTWRAYHCDAQGNDIPNDTLLNGAYPLRGTQSLTASGNNYPANDLGTSYPHNNGTTLPFPALEADTHGNVDYGIGYDGYFDQMRALNYVTDAYGSNIGTYTYTDSSGHLVTAGPWNGTVLRDAQGQLLTYFQWRYVNLASGQPMPPPTGSVAPDHLDLLLRTHLATTYLAINGGYVEASASDGAPFLEKVGTGQTFNGVHLVRSATDGNHVGEVYLNGNGAYAVSELGCVPAEWGSGGALQRFRVGHGSSRQPRGND